MPPAKGSQHIERLFSRAKAELIDLQALADTQHSRSLCLFSLHLFIGFSHGTSSRTPKNTSRISVKSRLTSPRASTLVVFLFYFKAYFVSEKR